MVDNDFVLIDMITGYQPAAAVTAGLETGLFDALEEGPASLEELVATLHTHPGSTHALIESLTALGMLTKEGNRYSNSSYVSERVAAGGPMASVIRKEAFFYKAWASLPDVVRTGEPALVSWKERLTSDPETAHGFLVALDVLAKATGPDLSTLPELAPGKKVVDVGGALGSYSRVLAEAGSTVTLVDLPAVIQWASERLSDVPGVSLVAEDVLTHPSAGVEAGSADAVLVSHMIHDLSPESSVDLLRRAFQALRPGGAVVVNDFAGDSGPGAFGPLFDLMMRVETGGAAYDRSTLLSMVTEAGFDDPRFANFDDPLTVIIATKPTG